jgi:hypothetical protein
MQPAADRDPSDSVFKIFVAVYFVVLFLCVIFEVRIGTGMLEIDLASPAGAALLALLFFGLAIVVLAVRGLEGAERWRAVLFGLVCVCVPVSILLCIHIGGAWGWVAGGLSLVICLIMGGLQKEWSLSKSVAACVALLGAMLLLALIFPHNSTSTPSREHTESVRKAFER